MAPALAATDLTCRYDDVTAVDGVDLEVAAGEVFALIGPNGAGKTTLVRALTGTKAPVAGTRSVLGAAPGRVDRERIGVLPQAFTPPRRLTGRELLRYFAGLYDAPLPVERVLSIVGMGESAEVRYERLSGGQQRRICVGIALVNDPEVLFLDEPTTGIDPAGRRALWTLLEERADGGTAILLTTHDMTEATTLADRVGLIDDGRLLETGPPDVLVDRHGGPATLEISLPTTDAGEDSDPVAVLEGAGFAVDRTVDTLVVRALSPRDVGSVVDRLEASGIAYGSVTWSPPTLEDVYLALTGDRYEPKGGVHA